jgi:hypothetical protein
MARAHLCFACDNPAVSDAMFTRATKLRFTADDAPAPLVAAFAELRAGVATVADGRDADSLSELLSAALHGLTTLGHGGRLGPELDTERIELLAAQFAVKC